MIHGVYYKRIGCPYCYRFEKYVLDPLEALGLIHIRRVSVDLIKGTVDISINRWISEAHGMKYLITPLLVVSKGYKKIVFAIHATDEAKSVEEEVGSMAKNFLEFVSKESGIPMDKLLEESPLLKKAVTAK